MANIIVFMQAKLQPNNRMTAANRNNEPMILRSRQRRVANKVARVSRSRNVEDELMQQKYALHDTREDSFQPSSGVPCHWPDFAKGLLGG